MRRGRIHLLALGVLMGTPLEVLDLGRYGG
jgi:hypothetical protein